MVTEIAWTPGEALASTDSGAQFRAPRVLITVPLGVLKSGSICFRPQLAEKEKVLQQLEMGPVVRASLCFRSRFWKAEPRFKDASFILTDDPYFPVWWTSNPLPFPILTGWAAGHYARQLGKLRSEQVIQRAVESLPSILEMDAARVKGELEAGFTHDWQHDRFSYFLREATDSDGHNGTVHGAIGSGLRAAKEILER